MVDRIRVVFFFVSIMSIMKLVYWKKDARASGGGSIIMKGDIIACHSYT